MHAIQTGYPGWERERTHRLGTDWIVKVKYCTWAKLGTGECGNVFLFTDNQNVLILL